MALPPRRRRTCRAARRRRTRASRAPCSLAQDRGPKRDVVLLNAAAALLVGGLAGDLREGIALAAKSIDSGAAWRTLEALIAFSQAAAG